MTQEIVSPKRPSAGLGLRRIVLHGLAVPCALILSFSHCAPGATREQGLEPPTEPPAGIAIYPGDDIQAKVSSAPPASHFLLKAGIHRQQTIYPRSGDIFEGESGTILDGEGIRLYAFDGITRGRPFPSDVVIRRLVIRGYNSPLQLAPILAGWHDVPSQTEGWVVEDNEITGNAALGIRIGSRMRVARNNIHHNGQLGIGGIGNGTVVEDNEIAYNNTANISAAWEAGGTKFVRTNDLIVRGNFVHHNGGPGLWTDISNYNTLYENNLCEDNAGAGIFHEISYKAVIRNNTVRRNGFGPPLPGWVLGAGIMVANSSNVEIYGNTVDRNRQGITMYHQVRTGSPSDQPYGPWETKGNYVHDNEIVMEIGGTGMAQDVDQTHDMFTSWNNRFQANRYTIAAPNTAPFALLNRWNTPAQWLSAGQDSASTFAVTP